MASCGDALPVLKCVRMSIASDHGCGRSSGADKGRFVDDVGSPCSTRCSTKSDIDYEDDHEDDGSISSSDSEVDDITNSPLAIRTPEAAKPTRSRPSVGLRLIGQQAEARFYAQHLSNSLVGSEAISLASQEGSNTTSSIMPSKLADATMVSISREEESGDAHPPLRTRRLDALMFRTSPASTGLCAIPTKNTSPSEVNAVFGKTFDEEGSRSVSPAIFFSVGSGGRRLCANRFSSAPTKPTSKKPAQVLGNRFASSRGTDAQASSSSQAHTSTLSEVVLMQKADSSRSGIAYNLVQFKASPSLSTTQDAGSRHRSMSSPRKTRHVESESKTPEVFVEHTAELLLKQTFSGWTRNEVKAALQGKFSPEDIAEVLEALELRSRKPSTKKLASL